jgi:ferrous iron transport protein B
VEKINNARIASIKFNSDAGSRKKSLILLNKYSTWHRHHTLLERLEDLSIRPIAGIPIALGVIYFSFWTVRFIGEGLISYLFEPFFNILWLPWMIKLSNFLGGNGVLHYILIGKLIDGKIDFTQSFGLLTTGVFVYVAMVFPYIIGFYFVLGLLEDFGFES